MKAYFQFSESFSFGRVAWFFFSLQRAFTSLRNVKCAVEWKRVDYTMLLSILQSRNFCVALFPFVVWISINRPVLSSIFFYRDEYFEGLDWCNGTRDVNDLSSPVHWNRPYVWFPIFLCAWGRDRTDRDKFGDTKPRIGAATNWKSRPRSFLFWHFVHFFLWFRDETV